MQSIKLLEKPTGESRYDNGISVTVNIENTDLSSDIQQEMSVQTSSDSSVSDVLAQSSIICTTEPGTQSLAFTNF